MGTTLTVLAWILGILMILAGFVGTVLPALPGTPLVFGGMLLIAWLGDFQQIGWLPLVILGFLTVLNLIIDFVSGALGAKRVGASWQAILGAAVGSIVGIFFALPGIIFGPFIGAVLGELIARPDVYRAGKVGLATWLGLLIGTALKLTVLFAMLGIFVLAFII